MKIQLKPIEVQVAVVFGASSGIGRLTALELAKRGAKVCAAARGEEGLKSLIAEIESSGGEAFYVVADTADFEQVKAVAEKTVQRYGRIDTWIHVAAVFLFATVEKSEPEEYKQLIEINLLGQIYGAKAALPHLKEKGGALIHISSVEAYRAAPYQSAYGASKGGLTGFLKVLRVELEHDRIPVSVTEIQPAAINTPIYRTARNKMTFKPRPVPPIYHPQIVVEAILYAAENQVRDLVAGAAGLGVVYAERFSPLLADWAAGTVGYIGQNSGEASDGNFAGNLFEPITGKDKVEGEFSGEQLNSDPYTWLKTNPKAKNGFLLAAGGILGGILAWRMLNSNGKRVEKAKRKMQSAK